MGFGGSATAMLHGESAHHSSAGRLRAFSAHSLYMVIPSIPTSQERLRICDGTPTMYVLGVTWF